MTRWLWLGVICVSLLAGCLLIGTMSVWTMPAADAGRLILELRLPRVVNALLIGASLGVAGAVFQGILHNPLADPYILGVSSGAALGACLAALIGVGSVVMLPISAVIGACMATLAVYLLARSTGGSLVHFILSGVMVNAFFAACNLVVLFLAGTKLQGMMVWLMGDLEPLSWVFLGVSFVVLAGITMVFYWLSPSLNIMSLGDDFALSLGVNVRRLRIISFVLASFLTGLAVACGGVIGFVGLMVPHTIRLLVGDDFRRVLPLSVVIGGTFLAVVDLVARVAVPDTALPIGVITALVGAPFFLWVLLRRPLTD